MFAKSATGWDATYRFPETSEVWISANDATRLIGRRVYDSGTGNLVQQWKPKQNSVNSTKTIFTYDARQLLPAIVVNEAGLQKEFTYEYGTGLKLSTVGPNTRSCTSGCPNDSLHPVKETHKTRVDGIGRPIERWETTSNDGSIYTLNQFDTTSYAEPVLLSASPASVTTQHYIDTSGGVHTLDKTEVDGLGRPLRTILFAQGAAAADQITTFHYRNDGTLSDVTVPDPTANNTSTVTYTYEFDSLGRATEMRRPDSAISTDRSGAHVSYEGLTQTSTELVPVGGGHPGAMKTYKDSFGRLTHVDENIDGATWATTTYNYGPNDAPVLITDPEGNQTAMTHDFAGRRTQITRGDRSWKYTYDSNGNVVSEMAPGSPDVLHDPLWTTTIAYDDLDRPLSKSIAKRDMSVEDQTLFGVGTESYIWDYGANHKGFLSYWRSFAPGAGTQQISEYFMNDNQGRHLETQHTMTVAGDSTMTRQVLNRFNLMGGVINTTYYDLMGTNLSSVSTFYDKRGFPNLMRLDRGGEPSQQLAAQTRNVAGLVTKRRTDLSGAMTFVESNWTYDKLGRPMSQVVQQGPGPVQVARQDLTYLGNDDINTLDHWLGVTNHKQFHYGFDFRHQLTSTTESVAPGAFTATYQYGVAGRFSSVEESAQALPGSDVNARNVDYEYADPDKERLTRLVRKDVPFVGQPLATFAYDAAGNQTSRCLGSVISPACGGDSIDYLYDGKNQLRRATKKAAGVVQGSEEYWYGGFGERIAIVKRDASGNKTEMIWFNSDTEAHYDGTGAVTHIYSNLSLGTPVARVNRTSNTATSLEFQFHGLANNTLATVDKGGTINASFDHAPFGELIETTDAGSANGAGVAAHRRRLNDKYVDELTDLSYYGARYYDKISMSWTQADPLYRILPDAAAEPRRANLYQFSLNNPVRYVDPDGLDAGSDRQQQRAANSLGPHDATGHFTHEGGIDSWSRHDKSTAAKVEAYKAELEAIADAFNNAVASAPPVSPRVTEMSSVFQGGGCDSACQHRVRVIREIYQYSMDDLPGSRTVELDGSEETNDRAAAGAAGTAAAVGIVLVGIGLFEAYGAISEAYASIRAAKALTAGMAAARAACPANETCANLSRKLIDLMGGGQIMQNFAIGSKYLPTVPGLPDNWLGHVVVISGNGMTADTLRNVLYTSYQHFLISTYTTQVVSQPGIYPLK